MTIQSTQGIINESGLKEGTGYVLLNRLHAVGFKKRPGQGEAPTPRTSKSPDNTEKKVARTGTDEQEREAKQDRIAFRDSLPS
ncbi:hypothetical protein DRX88_24975 [Salmonella enterica subsp. enterica serovar Saintpaul]|nr:hypothetical protein [Salmonella enterica subsp. enterica serovar Saintpaul]